MSTRTKAINELVQGTGLYQDLNKQKRKALVGMLDRAYRMGMSAEQKERNNGSNREPGTGARRLVEQRNA